jgi:hypothetical protein
VPAAGRAARCPHGGALVRPNILMFGDCHWVERFARAGRTPSALARRSDAAGGGGSLAPGPRFRPCAVSASAPRRALSASTLGKPRSI